MPVQLERRGAGAADASLPVAGTLPPSSDRTALLDAPIPAQRTIDQDYSFHSASRQVALARTGRDQEALIMNTPILQDWVFGSLHTAEAQLAALPKLELDVVGWLEREGYECENGDLKSYLVKSAKSPAVAAAIMERKVAVKAERREEQEVQSGERELGTVLHLRNFHSRRGDHDWVTDLLVGEYQGEILRELSRRQVGIVFSEWMAEDFPGTDTARLRKLVKYVEDRLPHSSFLENIEALFPKREIPEHFTDEQLKFLGRYGAELAYALLNPKVSILATTSMGDEARNIELIGKKQQSMREIVVDRREAIAGAHIAEYLRKHPGETVALVYGHLHRFTSEDFPSAQSAPRVVKIDWPELLRGTQWELPAAVGGAIVAAKSNPEIQTQVVISAHYIPLGAFHQITSAAGKMNSLTKLLIADGSGFKNDPERLAAYLLSNPDTGRPVEREVQAKIRSMQSNNIGIFKPLSAAPPVKAAAAG